mgnify:CR=1 FL=1
MPPVVSSFTDEEKELIKYFLSYPDFVSLSQSIQLGYPAASQPLFMVEDAFKRLTPQAENHVREVLCQLQAIEARIKGSITRLAVSSLGEIAINPNEGKLLRREMCWWVARLSDLFGVFPNPVSQMIYQALNNIGGISGRSSGSRY